MTDRDHIPLHKSDCALLIGGYQCTCGFHQRQNKTLTALAAEQPKQEPVAWQCREHGDDEWFDCSKEAYGINPSRYVYRCLYTAPPATHPGYVIGSHWLETAYSRICAGEAEADVLRDIGLVREEAFLTGVAHLKAENEALRRDAERLNAVALQAQNAAIDLTKKNERLREALKLALNSHGRMLMSDPPQDAWKFNRVDEVIDAALRREET